MFEQAVQIYRGLDKPEFSDDNSFKISIARTDAVEALIKEGEDLDPRFGEYEFFRKGSIVNVEGRLPRGDGGGFYISVDKFFTATPTLARGSLPDNFYVRSIDYSSTDQVKPSQIVGIEKVAKFIRLIGDFSEVKLNETPIHETPRLIFILPPDGKLPQRTIVVPIQLEANALTNKLAHLTVVQGLADPHFDEKFHIEERRLVMRSALGDVLHNAGGESNLFTYLVQHWDEVLKKYRHNFQAYINRFAFDDVRNKLAAAEIEYASKLSGVLGDIAGKLLAVPISIAALIPLAEAKTQVTFWIGFLGLCSVSLVYFFILANQTLQIDRLKSSFSLIFDPFFERVNTYPSVLKKVVIARQAEVSKQSIFLERTLLLFKVLSVAPASGAIALAAFRYETELLPVVARVVFFLGHGGVLY